MNTLQNFDTRNFSNNFTGKGQARFSPKSFGKNNRCPVCEKESSACRYNANEPDFIQCHLFADARKGEKVNGFVCVKEGTGHTASFKPDNRQEWSQEQRREWKASQDLKKRKEAEDKAAFLKVLKEKELGPLEKHNLYSEILDFLPQDNRLITHLQKRGFTPSEIAKSGFKSVSRYQKLPKRFDTRLPGINDDGRSLICKADGYACPVRNFERLIVGLQFRFYEGETRYSWGSREDCPVKLVIGDAAENPLPVFIPEKPKSIGICEGTGPKPFLASERLNILMIGCGGSQWASSPNTLKAELEKAQALLGGEKHLTIYPDAGAVGNKSVVQALDKLADLLIDFGWSFDFAWWGQRDKSWEDIDELPTEKYQFIEFISIERFTNLCRRYGGTKPEQKQSFADNYQDKVAAVQKKLHTLSYAADIECDPHQKYLPSLVDRIPCTGIVLIKGAKGCGKSHQIKHIKQKFLGGYWEERIIDEPEQLDFLGSPKPPKIERIWHEKTGKKFISINARIALGREQAIRWEFTWIEDTDFDKPQEFNVDGEIIQTATVLETIEEIGLCWDSLGKLFDRDWSNTLVVIDELELGLNHASTSSTCRDRRSKILHTVEQKLKNECLPNGGLLLGADADLTDISYEYLSSIAPNDIPFIVRQDYQRPDEDKWLIEFHTGKRDDALSQVFDHLANENCEPIAFATDNQSEAEALHNALCKRYPYLKKEIGGAIRIDSKITQTDFGKNFVKRPNESTEKYQPKILIYTPSLGVGCSIDIDYYQKVYGLSFGNQEPSQARQMLARVRLPVPRIVWCKERGTFAENDHTSFLPDVIKKQMFQYQETSHDLIDTAVYLAKEKARGIDNDAELLPHLIEVLQGMMGENGTWNNPHIDLVCKQKARRNFALSQLAVQLRQELIDEGHNLVDYAIIDKSNAGEIIGEEKKEIKQHRALMSSQAQDITIDEAKQIDRKIQKTDEEEYQSIKAHLKEELPGIELTQEFIYKAVFSDNRRWLNQVKLFWMFQNPEATKEADRKHWKYKLKQFSDGVACIHDIRTFSPKIDAINKSKLLEVIKVDDFDSEYHENDEHLKEWFNDLLKRQRKNNFIKVALKITVSKDSQIIKLINKLLGRIGLKLRKTRQGTDGTNYYRLDREMALDPNRIAVLQSLTRKHEQQQIEQLAKEEEVLMQRAQDAIAVQHLAELQLQAQASECRLVSVNSQQSTVNSHEENMNQQSTVNSQQPVDDKWFTPENLQVTAGYLDACENPEMLADLREEIKIPAPVLVVASRQLSREKRELIRQWVQVA